MARDKVNNIDQTFLSLAQATKRGFLHRDYVAHCLRWTHVLKHLKPTVPTKVLELGCGVEAPLAKTLYSSRHTMHQYLGVDYGPIEPEVEFKGKFQPHFLPHKDISALQHHDVVPVLGGGADLVVSFEVAEHMEPDRWVTAVLKAIAVTSADATFLFSTPCYDAHVGPADNHINEWTYEAFLYTMESCGLKLVDVWGTFASQKDYKKLIHDEYGYSGQAIFDIFSQYFDSNMLACVMAPLFPTESRNCLWQFQYDPDIPDFGKQRLQDLFESHVSFDEIAQCTNKAAWLRVFSTVGAIPPTWLTE